ncbi:type I-E CRISPR-associated endoribonuclease Cas2 [Megasphaera sp.]|uniref:type I-E CRISPR-associated endoribonuclease Cas2 n=1 Tax=Megasphaera sp. TaxID=2023260 RepID=UPI0035228462
MATGVYVGNFNSRIREYLWRRVQETMGAGEASMCFAARNELGYDFLTENASRSVIDYDGLPLIFIPKEQSAVSDLPKGFSTAAKLHRAHIAGSAKKKEKPIRYVVIDIETDGKDAKRNHILEIGAIRCEDGKETHFTALISGDAVPPSITKLTGITATLLQKEGQEEKKVLTAFREFIGDDDLVGYHVSFDIEFLRQAFKKYGLGYLKNKTHDLLRIVKKEQLFQADYKLETSLQSYGIHKKVPHRALGDAELVKCLAKKLNKF